MLHELLHDAFRDARRQGLLRGPRGGKAVMIRNDDFPRLLAIREAADYLCLSTATLRRLVLNGEISCARSSPRGKRLFSIEELESFICRSTVHASKSGEVR